MRVAILAAMRSELRAVVRAGRLSQDGNRHEGHIAGHDVSAALMGVGMQGAWSVAEAAVARGVDHVVVSGIAGRVDPALAIGHVVVPEVVVDGASGAEYAMARLGDAERVGRLASFDDFGAEMARMNELQAAGLAAVDMETAAVAAACSAAGVPVTAFRCLSDDATDGTVDAAIAAMVRPDGSADAGAALRYVVRRPWRIPRLARLGRDSNRAARAAAEACVAALAAQERDDR